ncbi:hypothetical protein Tco_1403335 [Tanacetum coccineum]
MDKELRHLTLKGDDIEAYNIRFHSLALMCLNCLQLCHDAINWPGEWFRANQFSGLLIYSKSEEEHEDSPETILELLLKKEKLYSKFSKCEFWLKEVQFLGHVVNHDGIHVDLSKVESVKNWKTAESSTEIRSFLGLAGYYKSLRGISPRLQSPSPVALKRT